MRSSKNREQDPVRDRIRLLLGIFILFAAVVFIRLFTWQILRAQDLKELGFLQHNSSQTIKAKRGSILASDDFPVAASTQGWLVWAALPDVKDPKEIANEISPLTASEPKIDESKIASVSAAQKEIDLQKLKKDLISQEKDRIYNLLIKKGVVWVPIKHEVETDLKLKIERMNFSGIGFSPEEKRVYPEASMSAHLLGFVGKDSAGVDKGYFGLEGKYDLTLSGSSGNNAWEKDALGNPILSSKDRSIAAMDGLDLKTHINRSIQFVVEKDLADGIEKYGAEQGTAIVMRPSDGAILAMASVPSYNPQNFSDYKNADFINPAISQSFEPGSIFKVIVMAAALDANVVNTDSKCDSCDGPRNIAGFTIHTWDDKYHPNSTPAEIIEHSDNVGMIWVGEKLGIDKFYDYITKFGIGSLTGIDLQGEVTPDLRKKSDWGLIDLATASFGQGIAVTPIQMVRAVSAIANHGNLPVPEVVDKIQGDGLEENIKPVIERNVISEKAAQEITNIMVDAVRSGEAKWAAPKHFLIAGKTGTAQIPVAGHYDPTKTIASFVGFAPADNPKFAMIVTLMEPKSSQWASETAAPLWFNIAEGLFPFLDIHPE